MFTNYKCLHSSYKRKPVWTCISSIVVQSLSYPTLCDPTDCSTPSFPVPYYLPEFAQTHVHLVGDAIQISPSGLPFSWLQSFPASGSFQMSWLFPSAGQSLGASASALLMNIQGWFPLGLTDLISLQSKGFSRVFSNITVQKHQFFGAETSSWSNSHIRTWLLEKP